MKVTALRSTISIGGTGRLARARSSAVRSRFAVSGSSSPWHSRTGPARLSRTVTVKKGSGSATAIG
ncbi:hypothetical protein GCM10025734_03880 [Kitasatospora paranensis]